jgi:hypothetical protein
MLVNEADHLRLKTTKTKNELSTHYLDESTDLMGNSTARATIFSVLMVTIYSSSNRTRIVQSDICIHNHRC